MSAKPSASIGLMSSIVTSEGLSLHTREWPAAAGTARGTVLIVHGLGDHVGRYANVAAALNAAGWRVVGYDQRGHGRSEGKRGTIAAAHSLLADLALAIDVLCAPADATRMRREPVVLLGDSMGGTVAGRFVAEALADAPAAWSRPVDGLALVSPVLSVEMTPLQKLLLAVLEPLAPSLPVSAGIELDNLSHDPAIAHAYRADPLVHDRITARLARFLIEGAAAVRAAALGWRLQTLLLWGGGDRIVSPEGARAFAAASPASVVTAHEYPGLYHEILNEVERGAVHARLEGWLACI